MKKGAAELEAMVQARQSHLMDIHGIGPVVAARSLADVGDVARFADRNRFATWTGIAPLDASSGEQNRHPLSRAGKRRVNHVIRIAAVTQPAARHRRPGQLPPQTSLSWMTSSKACTSSQCRLVWNHNPGSAASRSPPPCPDPDDVAPMDARQRHRRATPPWTLTAGSPVCLHGAGRVRPLRGTTPHLGPHRARPEAPKPLPCDVFGSFEKPVGSPHPTTGSSPARDQSGREVDSLASEATDWLSP